MMNSRPTLHTKPMPQQHFFVPQHAPFLEIRTTLHSEIPYAAHFHSAFSLGLILEGKTRFSVTNAEHRAETGDIVLIAQGQAHSCNPMDGPRGYHMLLIDVAWIGEDMTAELTACPPLIRDAALFSRAVRVVDALLAGREDASPLLSELLMALRTRYGRAAMRNERVLPWPGLQGMADPPPSVAKLAREAGMRRESFSRAIRQKTGLPPSRYLHCLRLEKARRLLQQGKSIVEAALAAGYADQSHFHRMFVKFCAVTPGRYRSGMSHSYKK